MGSEMCIRDSLDSESGAVRVLAVDYTKAFDNLQHSKIFDSCVKFNLSKSATRWICDFLKGRKQCVRYKSTFSTRFPSHCGVPQAGEYCRAPSFLYGT